MEETRQLPSLVQVAATLQEFPEIRGPVRLSPDRRDTFALALAERGFVLPFAWSAWASEGSAILADPQRLARADLETVCRLLTVIVRGDRFVSGEIDAALGDGRFGALMERLAAIVGADR